MRTLGLIEIGGVSLEELTAELKKEDIGLGYYADTPEDFLSPEKRRVKLAVVSESELGFTRPADSPRELANRVKEVGPGLGIALCPPEAIYHIALNDVMLPPDSSLYLAMEPLTIDKYEKEEDREEHERSAVVLRADHDANGERFIGDSFEENNAYTFTYPYWVVEQIR